VRILVTNDDGVHAPGLGALTRELAKWVSNGSPDEDRQLVVVAPLSNYSGASAAVGTVYERESISYRSVNIEGAEEVPTFGLDASPALSVIVGALGGFGPRPDLIVSGINLGVNVGRSVLHSGTVGAVLTGAQLGISGLAVSLRSGVEPERWETAAALAAALVPLLGGAPARTVLNLNVPSLSIQELRGIRRGRISTAGIIKAAIDPQHADPGASVSDRIRRTTSSSGLLEEGEIVLQLGAAVPSLGDVGDEEPDDDGALVAAGFASLTPLMGVREDSSQQADDLVRAGVSELSGLLGHL
jgi:5'-nucleotidase